MVVVVVAWLDMTSLSTRGWEIGLYAGETHSRPTFSPTYLFLPLPPLDRHAGIRSYTVLYDCPSSEFKLFYRNRALATSITKDRFP